MAERESTIAEEGESALTPLRGKTQTQSSLSPEGTVAAGADAADAGAGSEKRASVVGAHKLAKRFSRRLSVSQMNQFSKRMSIASSMTGVSGGRAPVVRLQPTYRIEPRQKLDAERIGRLLNETLHRRLSSFSYNRNLGALTCKSLADEFKAKAKEIGFDRYKFVVVVTLGEKKGQGAVASSRCLWDPRFDSFATATHESGGVVCTALVFGLYRE